MPGMKANPGPFKVSRGGTKWSFTPNGKLYVVGDEAVMLQNPVSWKSEGVMQSSRIFCGLEEQDKDGNVIQRWGLEEDMIPLVQRMRVEQQGDPGASFIAQKGLWKREDSGIVIKENSAQVIVFNIARVDPEVFEGHMVAIAEALARTFHQELVIVEMQMAGISQSTIGVRP